LLDSCYTNLPEERIHRNCVRIGAQHGWSIVIDNRSGAAGMIGVMAAKQAAADGHTLVVVTTSTHGSMSALKRNLDYDAVKDFAPIVLMADAPPVRDDLPARIMRRRSRSHWRTS
jgi:Tripartite tricarboxylate transporter family receptor